MARTFVLGLGAQKAGTTWLHDYLTTLNGVDMGFIKEYHFWDVAGRDQSAEKLRRRGFKRKLVDAAQALLQEEDYAFQKHRNIWIRLAWHSHPELYFDYFAGLLTQDGIQLTGDLTPDHSALDSTVIETIKAGFALRGIEVRPVFIMRDPVERIWSAIRMNRRKGKELSEVDDEKEIIRRLGVKPVMNRSRYDLTLQAIGSAFGTENAFVGLYEDLFSAQEVQRLCRFLHIDYVEPEFEKRLNETTKTGNLSQETVARVAQHLKPSYLAAAGIYGQDRLLELWPSARHVF